MQQLPQATRFIFELVKMTREIFRRLRTHSRAMPRQAIESAWLLHRFQPGPAARSAGRQRVMAWRSVRPERSKGWRQRQRLPGEQERSRRHALKTPGCTDRTKGTTSNRSHVERRASRQNRVCGSGAWPLIQSGEGSRRHLSDRPAAQARSPQSTPEGLCRSRRE